MVTACEGYSQNLYVLMNDVQLLPKLEQEVHGSTLRPFNKNSMYVLTFEFLVDGSLQEELLGPTQHSGLEGSF
jgi:hypothetical protein